MTKYKKPFLFLTIKKIRENLTQNSGLAFAHSSLSCVCPQPKQTSPALLEVAEHRDAGRYYSIIHEYPYTLILADHTHHIQPHTHGYTNWPSLSPTCAESPKPNFGFGLSIA